MNADVAFEIDEFDEHHARSVCIRGVARHLGEDEEHRAENVPLRPWVPTLKYDVVEIRPTEISGRAFELSRPWLHMIPERRRRGLSSRQAAAATDARFAARLSIATIARRTFGPPVVILYSLTSWLGGCRTVVSASHPLGSESRTTLCQAE